LFSIRYLLPPDRVQEAPGERVQFVAVGRRDQRLADRGRTRWRTSPRCPRRASRGQATRPPEPVDDGAQPLASALYTEDQVDSAATRDPNSAGPNYPDALREQGVQGEVLVEFTVDTTGRADPGSFAVVEASHPLFAEAVRDALPKMLFTPAVAHGQRVRQLVRLPMKFRLLVQEKSATEARGRAAWEPGALARVPGSTFPHPRGRARALPRPFLNHNEGGLNLLAIDDARPVGRGATTTHVRDPRARILLAARGARVGPRRAAGPGCGQVRRTRRSSPSSRREARLRAQCARLDAGTGAHPYAPRASAPSRGLTRVPRGGSATSAVGEHPHRVVALVHVHRGAGDPATEVAGEEGRRRADLVGPRGLGSGVERAA
jgi:TonB family protein